MVCLGNICRSPMAEGILRQKLENKNLPWKVDSAGTSDYHIGQSPEVRAVSTLKKQNIDISNLQGRQLTTKDFDEFDAIYVMDQSNYENAIRLARNKSDLEKVVLIMNMVYPKQNISVPDPYFGGIAGFDKVFEMLNLACDKIIEKHLLP